MNLKVIVHRERKRRGLKKGKCRLKLCPRCKTPMPNSPLFELPGKGEDDGTRVCRPCYVAGHAGKISRCPRCRREKPRNQSFFYKRIRGRAGLMSVCRMCRDSEFAVAGKKMCGSCSRPYRGDGFSKEEWDRPLGELAKCIFCIGRKKVRPFARMGEKVCPRCGKVLAASLFYTIGGRLSSYCKDCTRSYNSQRYRATKGTGRFSKKSDEAVFYLERGFTQQELVDRWAEGEVPKAKGIVRAPKENFEKEDPNRFRKFMGGFETALGLNKGRQNGANQTEEESPTPLHKGKKKVTVKATVRVKVKRKGK